MNTIHQISAFVFNASGSTEIFDLDSSYNDLLVYARRASEVIYIRDGGKPVYGVMRALKADGSYVEVFKTAYNLSFTWG